VVKVKNDGEFVNVTVLEVEDEGTPAADPTDDAAPAEEAPAEEAPAEEAAPEEAPAEEDELTTRVRDFCVANDVAIEDDADLASMKAALSKEKFAGDKLLDDEKALLKEIGAGKCIVAAPAKAPAKAAPAKAAPAKAAPAPARKAVAVKRK
jgi:hypothetical protein